MGPLTSRNVENQAGASGTAEDDEGERGAPDCTKCTKDRGAGLRSAPGERTLPAPTADLLTRAAAICAGRGVREGATTAEIEAILSRGLAQAAALRTEVA